METAPIRNLSRRRRPAAHHILQTAITVAATAAMATACAPTTVAPNVTDWCWLHFGLAPPGALVTDDGPPSLDEASLWIVWLDVTSPAPSERAAAHDRQLELAEQFASIGSWTPTDRDEYRDAALTDPTPATICETSGARIIPRSDGALDLDWDQRFLDPANPAFSMLAARGTP